MTQKQFAKRFEKSYKDLIWSKEVYMFKIMKGESYRKLKTFIASYLNINCQNLEAAIQQ